MGLQVREHGVTKRLVAQNVAETKIGGVSKAHLGMSYGHFGRYEAILVIFSDIFRNFKKFRVPPRPVGSELRPQNW